MVRGMSVHEKGWFSQKGQGPWMTGSENSFNIGPLVPPADSTEQHMSLKLPRKGGREISTLETPKEV